MSERNNKNPKHTLRRSSGSSSSRLFGRISPRRLSLLAMLIALQVVLSKFLMLQVTSSIRLSIDSVPILLAGVWFGPLAGVVVGMLADLLGTLLFPTAGMYYPPLTIAFILIGVCAGLLGRIVRVKSGLLRAALIVLPSEIAGSLLFKSLALSWLVGIPFFTMLLSRALPVLLVMSVNTMIVFLLDRLLGKKVRNMDASRTSASAAPARPSFDAAQTMNYDEALAYIHSVTWRGSRLGLDRTKELLSRIGDPQKQLRFIHIAGTNGKGSTAAMLAKMLQLSGYRTGLYISPFINRFNERMQLNGESISDGDLASITAFIRPHADAMADHPTEFELITVIALEYFRRVGAEIVVLEVGMGGDLDSTNVIDTPELAIITNIGLDHTRELGGTIPQIARTKAGIIKKGGDVLIYGLNAEADAVFEETCRERGAVLHVTDHSRVSNVSVGLDALRFSCVPYGALACGLIGAYQAKNAAVAITAAEILQTKGWHISAQAITNGLLSVRWPARFELLKRDPLFIADGGHNPQGISAVAESLKLHFPNHKITFLLGVMADKDISSMIGILCPIADAFFTVTPNNPRAMDAEALAVLLRERGCATEACDSVASGVRCAIGHAGKSGVVCALGSLYLLGDVRAALGAEKA